MSYLCELFSQDFLYQQFDSKAAEEAKIYKYEPEDEQNILNLSLRGTHKLFCKFCPLPGYMNIYGICVKNKTSLNWCWSKQN